MSASPTASIKRALLAWYREQGRHDLPWRTHYEPYAVLISEMMLQQTQVSRVIGFFERWMERFPTLEALASAELDEVLRAWQGLGYYRRARALKAIAEHAATKGGTLPTRLDALLAYPGIGPYTAAALLAFAHDQPEPAIDTNLRRVLARAFGGGDPHAQALALFKGESPREVTSALMDFGSLVCTARTPSCESCAIRKHCVALAKNEVELSVAAPRSPAKRPPAKLAIGVIREGSTPWLPARSGLLIARLGDRQSPRAALQAESKRKLGVEIAVRPEAARREFRGELATLHRCTALLGQLDRLRPADAKRIARLSDEEREVLRLLKLLPKAER